MNQNDSEQVEEMRDVSLSMGRANLIGLPLGVVAFLPFLMIHYVLWGDLGVRHVADETGFTLSLDVPQLPWWGGVVVVLIGLVTHEALHALGFYLFGKVNIATIRFGFNWRTITPFAHCSTVMSASAYKGAVLLPPIVLGFVPGIFGIALGVVWFTAWGSLFTAVAVGDLLVTQQEDFGLTFGLFWLCFSHHPQRSKPPRSGSSECRRRKHRPYD